MKVSRDTPTVPPATDEKSAEKPLEPREFSIDELAREAGTTVRNVRAYQEKGLLPPPERRGRSGIYTHAHLARLRVIARMLERGYSLANVAELLTAWEGRHDIGQLLGLEAALTSPWSDETPVLMTAEQLLALFGGNLKPDTIKRYLALGILKMEEGQFLVSSPKMIQVGAELIKEGVPLDGFLSIIEGLRGNIERAASEFVQLIVRHVFDRYGKDRLPPPEEAPRLADLVWRMRPMAMQAVDSEVARAMELAANHQLGERLSQVLEQMHRAPKPASVEKSD